MYFESCKQPFSRAAVRVRAFTFFFFFQTNVSVARLKGRIKYGI